MNILYKVFSNKKIVKTSLSTSILALGTTVTYFIGKQLAILKRKYLLSQDSGVIIYEIDHSNPESGIKEISFSDISEKQKSDILITPHLKFNMKYFLTPLGYMQYLVLRKNNEMMLTFCSSPKQIDLMGEFMESMKIRELVHNSQLNTLKV
jgi:hypothetical protein